MKTIALPFITLSTLAALSFSQTARAVTWLDCTDNVGGGYCVDGSNHSTNSNTYGIYASAQTIGVSGYSYGGQAIEGDVYTGIGVKGIALSSGLGVSGISSSGHGVYGGTSGYYGAGVYARNEGGGTALYAFSEGGSGYAAYLDGKIFAGSAFKPGGGSWSDSSDIRMKKDVKALDESLDRLLRLRGVTFEWIEPEKHGNRTGTQIGMIAQEVEKVFPDWVGTDADGFKTLTFRGFEALAVEGMRSLHNENEALRSQVSSFEDRIKKLESSRPIAVAGFSGSTLGAAGAIALALGMVLAQRRRSR